MPHLIDVLFKVINDRVQCASELNTLLSPAQVLQMAYHTVSSSGIYIDACKYWCRNTIAENTWDNFKIFIWLEYNELREEQCLNETQAGFQHSNHA